MDRPIAAQTGPLDTRADNTNSDDVGVVDAPDAPFAPPPAEASPPPPPPPAAPTAPAQRQAMRAGQVTVAWQIMLGVTWAAVFFAFAATWKASEEIGIGTWWLGPRSQPRHGAIKSIPFALAVLVALAAIYNVRRVAWVSVLGSFGVALIAVFDVSRSGGLAAIEFAIAAAAGLVSLAALSGTYRAQPPTDG